MKIFDLATLLKEVFEHHSLILGIISAPRAGDTQKIEIRPLLLKNQKVYQRTEFRNNQAFHKNLTAQECQDFLQEHLLNFKQAIFYSTDADYHVLVNKKQQVTILSKPSSRTPQELQMQKHNRAKNYLLEEGTVTPFLVELDIMNRQGQVYPKKQDKFKQINRFLEMVADIFPVLENKSEVHIVDFGCGKAYLTFALYHYLKIIKGLKIHLVGLDLKPDVIQKCTNLAKNLGYSELLFMLGDINGYTTQKPVDMVVSLHACDTATDAALEKAIAWQADVILCVPCCQHELYEQVQSSSLTPLLKHGILRERFAALATDAARAQLLEIVGYRTQIIEFIDLEHTPKNLLIRAVKVGHHKADPAQWQTYLAFKESLKIDPSLERRLVNRLPSL